MKLMQHLAGVFRGKVYRHRSSTVGDRLSRWLFEDLYDLGRSKPYIERVDRYEAVVNRPNTVTGRSGRRGDGTFGERIATSPALTAEGRHVAEAEIATLQVGVEVKILATAMIKQIDRVIGDMNKQASQFRATTPSAITIGLVPINHATTYRSYEGERYFDKPGKTGPAPAIEAKEAKSRIERYVRPNYDELIFFDFRATNMEPFPFEWVNEAATRNEYVAALQRIAQQYDTRFP